MICIFILQLFDLASSQKYTVRILAGLMIILMIIFHNFLLNFLMRMLRYLIEIGHDDFLFNCLCTDLIQVHVSSEGRIENHSVFGIQIRVGLN